MLTAAGRQILEEMAVALHKVGGKKLKSLVIQTVREMAIKTFTKPGTCDGCMQLSYC